MTFLAPAFLVTRIPMIAIIVAGAFLVYFGSFVHSKIILPLTDLVRAKSHKKIHETSKFDTSKAAKIVSNALATIFFLLYVYFGSTILSEYIFEPIIYRLRNIVLITVIVLFLVISYFINTSKLRKKFMGM